MSKKGGVMGEERPMDKIGIGPEGRMGGLIQFILMTVIGTLVFVRISEGETIFVIDPDKCTECKGYYDEQQCASVCPVDACIPDSDHVETEEQLLAKKARHDAKV